MERVRVGNPRLEILLQKLGIWLQTQIFNVCLMPFHVNRLPEGVFSAMDEGDVRMIQVRAVEQVLNNTRRSTFRQINVIMRKGEIVLNFPSIDS